MANWYFEQITETEINELTDITCKLGTYLSYAILNWSPLLLKNLFQLNIQLKDLHCERRNVNYHISYW